jgi:cytochrome P450
VSGPVYPTAADLGVDVFNPAVFARGMPWADLARLREEAPVCWHEEPPVGDWPAGPGFWAVTRWEDIRTVGRAATLFSSQLGATQLRDPPPEDLAFWQEMLLNTDPPEHTRVRRIVGVAFTGKEIARQEPVIRERSRRLVDEIVAAGRCDFAEDIGARLPLLTIADLMGIPPGDEHLLSEWTDRVIGYQDPELAGKSDPAAGPPVNPRSREGLADMFEYARALREAKRKEPGDDLLSLLATAEVDGESLSVPEFETFFFLFTIAGNDTTHSALPGGLLALLDHPDELARLRADPGLLPSAVEECLRLAPPVIHFRRTAAEDTLLAGQPIAAGDKVVVFYSAANRDPAAFPDPDRFDITRTPNPHMAFGSGPHSCIAAGLARTQLRILWEEFLWRVGEIAVDGPVTRLGSNFINAIKNLPIRFDAGPAQEGGRSG